MRDVIGRVRASLAAGGRTLFTRRRPAWPLAIARIIIGLTILAWAVTMWIDVDVLLGAGGLAPPEVASNGWRWIPIETAGQARLALSALMISAVAIVAGLRPTIFLLAAFVLLVTIQRRNVMLLNSGDLILRDLTLLLAFCPTSAALSLDRVIRFGRSALLTSALVAPWGLRLVQLQMMLVYLFAFWSKSGDLWQNGSALSTVLRVSDLQRFGQPDDLIDNVVIIAALTWGALVVELALAALLWVKRLRPWLIVAGIVLHLTIDGFILVGFFGPVMVAGLMTFLDAERLDLRIAAWRNQRTTASGVTPASIG